ncbi:MAG: helix-turn-helix transcriptional regulator [Pedococcus sp.]
MGTETGDFERVAAEQAVLDAAAPLLALRSHAAATLDLAGDSAGVKVLAVGKDVNPTIMGLARGWRELLSVKASGPAEVLRASLPNNRVCMDRGMRMHSVFDAERLTLEEQLLLVGENLPCYRFSFVPVQMKIVERRSVLLQGPFVDGQPSVMEVSSPRVVAAAVRYWREVIRSSTPSTGPAHLLEHFTARQVQIMVLLRQDLHDEDIADALGISVRTVRSDIATIMQDLGVRSRFAAGAHLGWAPLRQAWAGGA